MDAGCQFRGGHCVNLPMDGFTRRRRQHPPRRAVDRFMKLERRHPTLSRLIERFKLSGMVVIKIRFGLFVSCFALLMVTGCARTESNTGASILLFNGTGTSPNDVDAIEKILTERGFKYATANSKQLNGMSESQIMTYRLIIVPGG